MTLRFSPIATKGSGYPRSPSVLNPGSPGRSCERTKRSGGLSGAVSFPSGRFIFRADDSSSAVRSPPCSGQTPRRVTALAGGTRASHDRAMDRPPFPAPAAATEGSAARTAPQRLAAVRGLLHSFPWACEDRGDSHGPLRRPSLPPPFNIDVHC